MCLSHIWSWRTSKSLYLISHFETSFSTQALLSMIISILSHDVCCSLLSADFSSGCFENRSSWSLKSYSNFSLLNVMKEKEFKKLLCPLWTFKNLVSSGLQKVLQSLQKGSEVLLIHCCMIGSRYGAHRNRASVFLLLGFKSVIYRSILSSDLYHQNICSLCSLQLNC